MCSKRAERELGWTAATPFSEGVRRYVEWRLEYERQAAEREAATVIPAGEPDAESGPRKVLIISADIGEGHDLPARAVAREFKDEDPDALVAIVNGLPAMGAVLTKTLRENSAFMFRWIPWWFDFQYRLFMSFWPTRWLAQLPALLLGRRGMMRLIRAHDPDLIVSTYPGTTALLGHAAPPARSSRFPCYSSITDLAGLRYWAHPRHRPALHHPSRVGRGGRADRRPGQRPLGQAADLAGVSSPPARAPTHAARSGLPAEGKVIAVSGGGWGVGDLLGATRAALQVSRTRSCSACAGATTSSARAWPERSGAILGCG